MRRIFLGVLIFTLLLTPAGCGGSGGGGGGGTGQTKTGVILGFVYAPNETTPIIGATVTVEGTGQTATTVSQGAYTLINVPAGPQKIIAVKGNYRAETTVTVTKDQTTTAEKLVLAPTGTIGVVKGEHDDIGAVLTSLEIPYEEISEPGTTFADQDKLGELKVILFASGEDQTYSFLYSEPGVFNETIINNLRNFVAQGGSIYASDWAMSVIEALYPGKIQSLGQQGKKQTITEAPIRNPDIQTFLGKGTANVKFNFDFWVVIESVADGVTVDLEGTVQTHDEGQKANTPLVVHFSEGKGYVVYTSFYNEATATDDMKKILNYMVLSL